MITIRTTFHDPVNLMRMPLHLLEISSRLWLWPVSTWPVLRHPLSVLHRPIHFSNYIFVGTNVQQERARIGRGADVRSALGKSSICRVEVGVEGRNPPACGRLAAAGSVNQTGNPTTATSSYILWFILHLTTIFYKYPNWLSFILYVLVCKGKREKYMLLLTLITSEWLGI